MEKQKCVYQDTAGMAGFYTALLFCSLLRRVFFCWPCFSMSTEGKNLDTVTAAALLFSPVSSGAHPAVMS
jgi:hypothetical protein